MGNYLSTPEPENVVESDAPRMLEPLRVSTMAATMPYDTVGNYHISKMCFQSYPCRHNVINMVTKTEECMSADNIYKMLEKEGLSYEHVNYCKPVTVVSEQ